MSSHQQPCPECGRLLELPAGAAGKSARCPACQAVFRVGGSDPDASPEAPVAPGETPASAPGPLSSDASDRGTAAGAPYHSRSPVDEPARINPYQTTAHTVQCGPYSIVDRDISTIVSATWAIFTERFAPVVLSMLILMAVGMVGVFLMMILGVTGMAAANNQATAGVLAFGLIFLLFPVIILAGGYLHLGMARVMLAVARGQESPLSEMAPPLYIFGRFIGSGILLVLILIPLFAVVGLSIGGIQAAGGEGVLSQVIGSLLGSLAGTIVQFFMWPWLSVISDGKSTALGAIRDSFAIAMHKKTTTLLIVLLSFVLSMAGTLTCYIGNIVTYPLSMLLFAVGYLMITRQPISDPRFPQQDAVVGTGAAAI